MENKNDDTDLIDAQDDQNIGGDEEEEHFKDVNDTTFTAEKSEES